MIHLKSRIITTNFHRFYIFIYKNLLKLDGAGLFVVVFLLSFIKCKLRMSHSTHTHNQRYLLQIEKTSNNYNKTLTKLMNNTIPWIYTIFSNTKKIIKLFQLLRKQIIISNLYYFLSNISFSVHYYFKLLRRSDINIGIHSFILS